MGWRGFCSLISGCWLAAVSQDIPAERQTTNRINFFIIIRSHFLFSVRGAEKEMSVFSVFTWRRQRCCLSGKFYILSSLGRLKWLLLMRLFCCCCCCGGEAWCHWFLCSTLPPCWFIFLEQLPFVYSKLWEKYISTGACFSQPRKLCEAYKQTDLSNQILLVK